MNIVYKSLLTYGLFLSAFLTTNLIFGQAPCPPTVVTVPYIGGKVFLDYGQDGAFNTGIDQPVSGVTISVYSASNTLVGTATSTADGNYIFESASMTNGARYRLEFTNGPSEYEQTFAGTDSKTSVQFATASSCNINFGLMDPVLYCQTGPRFATNRFVEGNNSGTDNTIVSIEFNAAASASESNDPSLASAEAVANVTGTTLGLAYQRSSKNLFASAYMRRFAGFGPGGTGAIYRIPNPHDGALSGGLFVNLNTLFGSSVAGTDPHNFTTETSGGDVIDENSFNQVGRVSFGDIDISDDELSLWAVNLNDRSLYRIPLGSDPANPVAPTLSSQVTVIPLASTVSPLPNLPSGVANAELRPFALKYRKGVVYIGMVTNGQSGGPLLGLVYSYNTTTSTFTKELEFSLTYNRGCGFGQNTTCYGSANWQAWLNSNVWPTPTVSGAGEAGYPQPMLTDIEFDAAGNMLLALRDRWGDQGGRNAPQPNSPYTLRTSDAFGDLLMATKNSGAGWSINMANFTDPSTASGTSEPVFGTDNYGPVSGYYHEETGMGGMAVMMRQNMLIVPVMDARTSAFTNGVDWYNLSTSGLPLSKSITLLSGAANPFGKAHGLGEVELLCDLAPLEIGNFVWFDSNLNGIQDPAETAIANVSLELYTDPNGDGNPADGTLVGTTTTNATGNYYFNTSNVNLNGANGLLPNTNYLVQIGTADWTGGAGVGDLAGYQLTSGNVGGTGQPDVRDNDATLIASRPRIPLTTGANGKTNHTFDIGFKPACNLSATGSGTSVNCNGGNNGTATVTVSGNFIPVTYLWSNGATSQNITGLVAGTYSITVTESADCTAVASYVVTQPPALNLSTSVTNVLCHGNASGAINLTVLGGTSPYTYNWGGGVTTEDRTGLVAGNYSVTVTDANSCTAVTSATVSQPAAALSLSTGVTNVLCNGGASGAINLTVLGGTSPYNYNWGGGITTEDRSGLIAGTYTVTVTDSNGCSATTSASISEPTVLSAGTLTTPVSCNGGSNGMINSTVNGGTPGYSYNWGGGVTTEDRTGLLAGTYTVTVTDANGCTITTSATITEPTALLISCSKTDVSITNGSDGSATVNANGGTVTYSYLWSNGQTTSVINGISAGTYSVTVTDANGCSAFCSTTLTEPSCTLGLAISAEDALCNGDSNGSIDLTISGAQGSIAILWNDGATTEDRTGLTAGTYSVTVTDDGNCTASISITVNEPEELAMAGTVTDVTITNGTDGTIDIAVMGGTLPYSYLWSDGSTDEDRSNLPSGMYSVTVTDANGCTLDESFSINEPGCALSLNITAEDALCNGDANGSIDLTITGAQGSISIVWNDGATSEDRTGLTAGTYSVTVTDSGNCTATISVTVNEPDVLGMTGNVTNVTITNGSDGTISVTVTGGTLPYSYLWSDGATTEDRTGLTAGTYSVTVTDANDCADEASFTLAEPPCSLELDISAEDALCNGDANGSIDLTITGAQGSVTILWNDGATSEDRTGLTAGNYSVTVTDSGNCSATISVTVNEPEVLGMTGSVTNVTITNGSDGTISVTVSGGTTPYSYLWNDGSIDEDRINLPAGTYSVTVTDANGCLLEQSFSINEPGCALELEIDAEDALCNGDANGSIDLTITGAQGSVTILWNDGATSEDRTGLTTGNYSVTVTDSGNCSATISVTVNEPEVLGMTGSVTNVTITNGSDGTISVTVSGGTTPYNYLWNDGSTDEDRINLPAGTYSVTVTDANGCSLEQSFTINEPGCALELEIDAEDALCNGDANGSIDLTITGAQGSVTILWNDGATSEDRTGLTAGNYSVTVTDSGNCSATISVTVNEPEVLGMTGSVTNVTITNGSDGTISVTVSGGTSPYSYLWNDGSTDEDRINLPAGTYSVTVTDANGCSLEQSFTINEPGCALELEIDAEDALCNGDANGSINLIIMGAQGSLTFLWNDGATSEDRTGLSAGTYSVTVTDSGNCTASISVTVNEPEVLGMTGSITNVTITNGSDGTVNITVTGGTLPYSYLWSDGATTEDRTGLSAGTYSVTVTDANGCSEEASFTLSEPPCSLELDISAEDALCNGDANGSIDLTITGAQGSVTIFWNDGATTEDRTGLTAGTYSVTVTDSGNCSATISVSVNEPEVLGMTGSITNVTITNGNDGTVSITVTGGTLPYSYLWSDGATTEDRTGLSAGTYSVTVTDANGCLDEASFTLAEPPCSLELDISAEDALCNGDANGSIDLTITGTQGSVTILWNDGATTEDRTGLTAGTYSVTVTDDGECTASISVSVNEPEVLGMTGSVTNVTITNGSDGTVSITVTGGTLPYSYLWSDGATTEDRTGLTAGTYSVTVTDANGCLEEASFTLSEPPCSLELDISAEDALCNGEANGSIDLTITGAQGSVTILWNDGATTEDRTGLSAGTYSVTVTDDGECTASISVTVNEPEVLDMTGSVTNVTITNGSDGTVSISVTGGTLPYSYLWSDGATTEDRTGLTAGTYSVTVTDANGCLEEASFTLSEPPCSLELDISAEDALCNGETNGSIDLTITGAQGSVTILWNDGATTEDRTGLSAGTYSVTVTDDGECTASISVTVNEPEPLTINADIDHVSIYGGTNGAITLTVTGGTSPYSYVWNDGVTTKDRANLIAGTYSVTVTDANNCSEEATFTITEPYCEITDAGYQVLCHDNGTPTNLSDDTFSVTFNPTGIGIGTTYNISGDIVANLVPYGANSQPFGYFPIANGNLVVNIANSASPACQLTNITIEPPEPCSYAADLSLSKSVNNSQTTIGATVTYTLTVTNEGTIDATGVEVTDVLPVGGVSYVSSTPAQGSYDENTGVWSVGMVAVGQSATITIDVLVLAAGVWLNTAEITFMNEEDIDSTPDNEDPTEDDIDRACITIPLPWCLGETFTASVPDEYENVQWYKDGVLFGTGNTIILNDVGEYTYTATNAQCPADGCCPIIIEHDSCIFDLALIKQLATGQSSTVSQGDVVNYTITVYNQGELDAKNITITDYIPVGMTLADANWSDNGDGTASYTIAGPLENGTNTTINISLQVGATFQGTSLTNVSEISEAFDGYDNPTTDVDSTPDTDPDNDTVGGNDVTDNSDDDEDDHDPETIEVYQEFDLALIKQLSGGQSSLVNQGDIVNYTLTVYNQGTLTATNVTITDYIPVGMTLSDANWTDNGDGTASYTIAGPIAQSTSTTVTIALQVGATFQGTSLTNVSEISEAYDGDGNPGDDIDSTPDTNPDNDTNGGNDVTDNSNGDEDDHDPETIEVYQEFDLALIKQLSGGQPSLVNQGDIVNYTLTVYNQGTLTATNVTITDYIPVGMTLADANWTDNGDGTASYTIAGPIAQSTSTTVTIALQVGATFQGTSLTNVSEISEAYDGDGNPGDDIDSTPDTNPDNDTNGGNDVTDNSNDDEDDHDPETIEVYQEFDLALIKQLSPGQPSLVNQGDIVNYTLTVYNQGTLTATNVTITDYIPVGMTLADANWTDNGDGTASYTIAGPIAQSTSTMVTISLQVGATFQGTSLTNVSEISEAYDGDGNPGDDIDSTPDTDPDNDTNGGNDVTDNSNGDEDDHDPETIEVYQEFDLALIKQLSGGQPSLVNQGDIVNYTLTVYNQGTLTATNVTITDYIPVGMTLADANWTDNGDGTASYTIAGPIAQSTSTTVTIALQVGATFQGTSLTNVSEISEAYDGDGNPETI
ncbi:MAG: DUF11 domain-containing protein [Sphingobacteriales bacterium]|nr:MAG: DUF11 domain-containing protein [Sphingobacteriales bacterium]